MKSKRKFLLWTSLALFVVPELIWSPITNILFELFQSGNVHPLRDNLLLKAENIFYFRIVNSLQLVGLLATITFLFKEKNWNLGRWIFFLVLTILVLLNICVLYLSFALADIGI